MSEYITRINWTKFSIMSIATICIALKGGETLPTKALVFSCLWSWGNFALGFFLNNRKVEQK